MASAYRAARRAAGGSIAAGINGSVTLETRRGPERVDFDSRERLILYSDGLIEAIDGDGDPFGFERFEKTILACGHRDAEDIKKSLLTSIHKFTRNRPPEDDQTLVVVSFEDVARARAAV